MTGAASALHPPPTPLAESLAGKTSARLLLLPDLHVPSSPDILERILASRALKTVDHVVFLGDTVAYYGTDHEYRALADFLARLGKPYTAVIGNHEFSFEVHPPEGGQYGRIWKTGSPESRRDQLDKFADFFGIQESYWMKEAVGARFLHFMLTDWEASVMERRRVKHEHDALKELPPGGDAFIRGALEASRSDGRPIIAFCHLPLAASLPPEFVYYEPGRDPCLYLEDETLARIGEAGVPVLWCSGHVHLSPHHPDAGLHLVAPNLLQAHCPSSRWNVRRERTDIHAKRYEESYALILGVDRGRPDFTLWDWLADAPAPLPAAFEIGNHWAR